MGMELRPGCVDRLTGCLRDRGLRRGYSASALLTRLRPRKGRVFAEVRDALAEAVGGPEEARPAGAAPAMRAKLTVSR